jgi:hypothetical protein
MQNVTRRKAMQLIGTTGAAVLVTSPLGAAEQPGKKQKHNSEPTVASKAQPDSHGPREMFAVVDSEGTLRRGLHAVSSKRLDIGVYEVIFSRNVRRGVYLATPGGHGYAGVPLSATIAVMGRASDPRGVFFYTTNPQGDPLSTGFHLLVLCPEGYA